MVWLTSLLMARSAGRTEPQRDPGCRASTLLGTARRFLLMNILRAGCIVSHGSVWAARGLLRSMRALLAESDVQHWCGHEKTPRPRPGELSPRGRQRGCSLGVSHSPACSPGWGFEIFLGHGSDSGCPLLL